MTFCNSVIFHRLGPNTPRRDDFIEFNSQLAIDRYVIRSEEFQRFKAAAQRDSNVEINQLNM